MDRRVGGGRRRKARGWRALDQARPAMLLVALALAGCTERLGELNPVPFFDNMFNATHLEGRAPPPGLDQPWPHLSSVPARPEPPDPAMRTRVSAGLAEDRQLSRVPPGPASGARPGGLTVPAGGPPAPPRLASMPPVRLDPAPSAGPLPAPAAAPVVPQPAPVPAPAVPAPAPARTPEPAAPPPPPPRELLAPPPAPGRDLLAPPPPPSSDLLAPRRN
jgi:hypothetical protein